MNAPHKTPKTDGAKARFAWEYPVLLNDQLSDDERMVRDAAVSLCIGVGQGPAMLIERTKA